MRGAPIDPDNLECVIPAAGLATRMAGGTIKPLLELGGKSLVRHVIDNALEVCRRCIVVTGYRNQKVEEQVRGLPRVEVVHNADYEVGMFSSIRVGALHTDSEWFFVAPADMPMLTAAVFRAVRAGAADLMNTDEPGSMRGPVAFFPEYRGRQGHPVLISSVVVPYLERLPREDWRVTMKQFLSAWPVRTVALDTTAIHTDVDTPERLDELRRQFTG